MNSVSSSFKIPVAQPVIPKKAFTYINQCLKTGWISSQGSFITKFEKKFAHYVDKHYALTVTSGTTALHLALASLGLVKGDEVIVPTFTMIAPVLAVIYTGATPVLVDCEKDTWNMDVTQIESKITKKTKAIIVVHIYGHPVDMDPILRLAKKYNLTIIEDAAEALGALYKDKPVGSFGAISCFSLYANKLITTGEGGMIATNDKTLAEKIQSLRNMAYSPTQRFSHIDIGFNYRFNNIQAALGLAQMEQIKKYIAIKRSIAKTYIQYLKNISDLTLPIEKPYATNVYWMFGILTRNKKQKQQLRKRLWQKGIDSRDFFIPMHQQPIFRKMRLFDQSKYPVAENISDRGFYLPSGLTLTKQHIKIVGETIHQFYD